MQSILLLRNKDDYSKNITVQEFSKYEIVGYVHGCYVHIMKNRNGPSKIFILLSDLGYFINGNKVDHYKTISDTCNFLTKDKQQEKNSEFQTLLNFIRDYPSSPLIVDIAKRIQKLHSSEEKI
jgi:hypothetical protein